MIAKSMKRSDPTYRTRLPASSETYYPPLEGYPAQSDHGSTLEPRKRAHSSPLAAGLASELKIGFHPYGEDSPRLAAGRVQSEASRILIVDDDPDLLKLVSKMAARVGYRTTMAENALDALDHLTRSHYGLVLTDYNMPFMDGYQLAGQIKRKHFGTKVIIMTGNIQQYLGCRPDDSGIVDSVLLKPFSLKKMQQTIELVCFSGSGLKKTA